MLRVETFPLTGEKKVTTLVFLSKYYFEVYRMQSVADSNDGIILNWNSLVKNLLLF